MQAKNGILINRRSFIFSINELIVWFFIFWSGGFSLFIPLTIKSLVTLFISIIGLLYALKSWSVKVTKLDLLIIGLVFLVPVISALQAYIVFNQPIFMGILSLRHFLNLLIVYFFLNYFNNINILNCICKYQIAIMIFDTILLYGFNFDSNRLLAILPNDENTAFVKSAVMENSLRGVRLNLGNGWTYLSLCIWSAKYYVTRNKYSLLLICFVYFFVLFVTKSRISLITCFIISVYPIIRDFNSKNLFKLLIVSGVIIVAVLSIPGVASRFLVVFDLFGDRRTEGTGDFSGVARLNEILIALPYILKYPLFGVGNISYHFKDGFSGVLGNYFFVGDIGIIGMLFIGGINLCFIYYSLFKRTNRINNHLTLNPIYKLSINCIICAYMVLPLMGIFPLLDGSVVLAIVIYLAISKNKYKNAYRLSR